jgi:hypothetical protein
MTDEVLGKFFTRYGFTLGHPDDLVVILYHQGEEIATFSQTSRYTTQGRLRMECAEHLVAKHGYGKPESEG